MFLIKTFFLKLFNRLMGRLVRLIKQPQPLLLSGPGCSLNLCDDIARFGGTNVLIITDDVLVGLGLLAPITERLKSLGLGVTLYSGVKPDPTFDQVREGITLGKNAGCDAVLAVGGGSPIDSAKAISVGLVIDEDILTLTGFMKVKKPGTPLYIIPTTAGTGSEVSLAAVISDPVTHKKEGIASPLVLPIAAALDPVLMAGMPPHITASTGIDALTHAVESYISCNATKESDRLAIAAIKLIFNNLETTYTNGSDLDARQSMAIASTYAGLAFSKTLVGYVHAIAHAFGGKYATPHGLANGIVLPHVLRFSAEAVPARFAEMAIAIGLGDSNDEPVSLANQFVDAVQNLNDAIGIPRTLEALKEKDIADIATIALKEAHITYAVPRYLSHASAMDMVRQMKAA